MFNAAEKLACRRLIELALEEDVGPGDLTSRSVIPADLPGRAALVARQEGVLAGLPAAQMVFATVDPQVVFTPLARDGDRLTHGLKLARVTGPMRSILTAERTALNFVQHLGGVATLTRRHVDAVAGLPCQVLDTRKTLPGWRLLDKYAVRMGGGHNHRLGLYDGVLIKDNHLEALGRAEGGAEGGHGEKGIRAAVAAARAACPPLESSGVPLEIEVDDLVELDEALRCRPDIVLLDNMGPDLLRQAVHLRDRVAPGVRLEASGGVTLATLREIAATGVDRVSIGALTHSAPALDIALDYE